MMSTSRSHPPHRHSSSSSSSSPTFTAVVRSGQHDTHGCTRRSRNSDDVDASSTLGSRVAHIFLIFRVPVCSIFILRYVLDLCRIYLPLHHYNFRFVLRCFHTSRLAANSNHDGIWRALNAGYGIMSSIDIRDREWQNMSDYTKREQKEVGGRLMCDVCRSVHYMTTHSTLR